MELGCDSWENYELCDPANWKNKNATKKNPSATGHKTVSQSEARGKLLASYPQANCIPRTVQSPLLFPLGVLFPAEPGKHHTAAQHPGAWGSHVQCCQGLLNLGSPLPHLGYLSACLRLLTSFLFSENTTYKKLILVNRPSWKPQEKRYLNSNTILTQKQVAKNCQEWNWLDQLMF